MARNTDDPLTAAPAASSDEEEVASSDEQEEEQSESANSSLKLQSIKLEKEHSPKKPPPSASLQPQHSFSKSGSESDSESEWKDDRSVASTNPTVKPNASKFMVESRKEKNSSSQPREFLSKSGMKRSIGNSSEGNDIKRVKKGADFHADDKVSGEDYGKVKKLFQRVWNQEHEIILEGAVEYKKKTGTDASKNMKAFYDFIKQFLRIDVSKNQVKNKFWRLKKKYINNAKRGRNGQDPSFTKAHDKKVYDVSKMIWIVEKTDEASFRFNEDVPSLNIQRIETPSLGQNSDVMISFKEIMNFGKYVDENFLRRGLENIAGSKRAELTEQWKEIQISQLELCVKHAELVEYQAKLMLKVLR